MISSLVPITLGLLCIGPKIGLPGTRQEGYWVSKAVENYLSHGCPADKINLGLALATPIPQIVRESPPLGEIEKKLKAAGWYDSQEPPLKK